MKLYFAPDQDCKTPLIDMINGAVKSLTIADYSFSEPAVTEAIVSRHAAGVPTKVLLDKSQSGGKVEKPEVAKLIDAGVPTTIGSSDKHKIMHLKVAVADDTIAFGSYNFTNAANAENNVLAVYTSPEDSVIFVTQIDKAIDYIQNSSKLKLRKESPVNYKDVAVRAAKTFGQAVLAFVLANLASILSIHSLSTGKQLAFAALVAGVSAAWNLVLVPSLNAVKLKLGQ